jgi:predicted DNA-binding transcriptional regulator AlpA
MHLNLPNTGYLRLTQIIGQAEVTEEQAASNRKSGKGPKRPRPGIPAIIPVSPATWWAGCKSGRFPRGVKPAGGNITLWRVADIRAWLEADNHANTDKEEQ